MSKQRHINFDATPGDSASMRLCFNIVCSVGYMQKCFQNVFLENQSATLNEYKGLEYQY